MLLYLVGQYMKPTGIEAAAVQVTPPTGDTPWQLPERLKSDPSSTMSNACSCAVCCCPTSIHEH